MFKKAAKKIFINNYPRKVISISLAATIWFLTNHSLTVTKALPNIPIKIENLPEGKTVEMMQPGGYLPKRTTVVVTGYKRCIDGLNSSNLFVLFDLSNANDEWVATINKHNLRTDNPDINLSRGIKKVSKQNIAIELTKIISDTIPITVTPPIGEPPKGYHFIDVFPYQLQMTLTGPESIIRKLKSKSLRLTLNLNEISYSQLEELSTRKSEGTSDVVSFFIPDHWKQIFIPALSEKPIRIDDPSAKNLRIDFLRQELVQIEFAIPISIYFPPSQIKPPNVSVKIGTILEQIGDTIVIKPPLYTNGVSKTFMEAVRDMVEVIIVFNPNDEMQWCIQLINPKDLEEKYISLMSSHCLDLAHQHVHKPLVDDTLRHRFRNYANRIQLCTETGIPLLIHPRLEGNEIILDRRT